MLKFLREPLAQFLLLGAAIYGAYWLVGAPEATEDDFSVVVDETQIDNFIAGWQVRMGRLPTQQELNGLIDQFIREEILYREAKAIGLGENDPVTRRRLAQKLEFLTKDIARLREPAEAELQTYFQDNLARYQLPDLYTFTQIYFDPDTRGETTLEDATAVLEKLKSQGEPRRDALELGDRFMLQSYFADASPLEIRRQLGSGFAQSVLALESGVWTGPVLSGYGVHLVYLFERQDAPEPVFADVRDQVAEDWQVAQQEQFNEEYFAGLRSRYDVVVEIESAAGKTIEPAQSSAGGVESGS